MEEKNNKSNYKDCVFVTINTYKEKPEVKQESSDSSGFLGGYEVFCSLYLNTYLTTYWN
ncbi:hypothetical protein HJP15_13890 [Pseudoalteromonas sp. NEC-BIFX-2020_002]|uniref:hypothetical protein n=1 Tax=Pseudoalteromonas TaxID=53246 RepID=UPI000A47C968|nr:MULTISPECIES: hypothetical protein [Pseudoalteromonas]NNG43995.1 hypothetical protein [Pseudoalteromonas sp. NEC-BIFX-2020_002]